MVLVAFGRGMAATTAAVSDWPHTAQGVMPHLLIGIQPRMQELSEGETAEFTVTITNTSSIPFTKVTVSGSGASGCTKSNAGALPAGQTLTYNCSRANVSESVLLQLTASGQTSGKGSASDDANAFVNVLKPGLRIIKRPETQTVRAGETAQFSIVIFNNSPSVVLTNVKVDDSGVPDCDLDPSIPISLLPGDSRDYSCELPNVQEPSVGVATVQGKDPVENVILTATDAAWVELLEVSAALEASPASIPEPGGLLTFTADVINTGSIPLTLSALSTVQYGDLLDPDNPGVPSATNTCLQDGPLPDIAPDGGRFSCTFVAAVLGQPSNVNVILNTSAVNDENEVVEATTSTSVTIADEAPLIDVGVTANPNIVQAPAQTVVYTVRVDNSSPSDTATIIALEDSILGTLDGRGSCEVPTAAIPIGGFYTCEFSTLVSGAAGSSVTRTIAATARDEDPGGPDTTVSDEIEVTITDRPVKQLLLPAIAHDYVEPNNGCGRAYPILINRQYLFDIVDEKDYYAFSIPKAGKVRLEITNFGILDNQVSVYRKPCPPNLGPLVAQDLREAANKVLEFDAAGPGNYWIFIANAAPTKPLPPYGLIVKQN
jgi:hypothetical protein